ncbi:3'-5' exoribonuclease YhaM family protein [Candidatus Latescibacterota bacterium]
MSNNQFIDDISEGDEFTGFYVLSRCELKEYDGGSRLVIVLSDKSGNVDGVIWDDAQEMSERFSKGDVVKIKGRMSTYRDKPQVSIDKVRAAETGEYDADSFIPTTPKDISELYRHALEFIESINDKHLKALGKMIFDNDIFQKEYSRTPGGMKWHHSYLGGLLDHSIGVTEICDFAAGQHPDLNRDLLVLAALLHDVGKIKEYSATTCIEYTDEGRLEGHIVLGERFVVNMCDRVDGFPPKLKMLLSHLILSHQGHKHFSSPVEPMIPEGFVLYYADEIDSKLNALSRISDKTEKQGKNWSDYVNLLGRFIYVNDKDGEESI